MSKSRKKKCPIGSCDDEGRQKPIYSRWSRVHGGGVEAQFLDGHVPHAEFLHFARHRHREFIFEEPIARHFEVGNLQSRRHFHRKFADSLKSSNWPWRDKIRWDHWPRDERPADVAPKRKFPRPSADPARLSPVQASSNLLQLNESL